MTTSSAPQSCATTIRLAMASISLATLAPLASVASTPLLEQDADHLAKELILLEEVTVSAHLSGVSINATGVSVTVLHPETFEKQGITSLTGVLARTPGVFVLEGGNTSQRGSRSEIVIRGMNKADYTLAMVDDMRISDTNQSGGILFGSSNLVDMGSIEVIRGSQGAIYGANAIGGVIAMHTPTGSGAPSVKLFGEAGSHNSFTGSATYQGETGKFAYFLGFGYETTKNDPKHPATFSNSGLGANDFYRFAEALRLTYNHNESVRFNFTFRRFNQRQQYPYYDTDEYAPAPNPTIYTQQDYTSGNLITGKMEADITELWKTSLMFGFYNTEDRIHSNAPPSPWGDGDPVRAKYKYNFTQIEWRNSLDWNKQHTTTFGMLNFQSHYNSTWQAKQRDIVYSFFAEHTWSPIKPLNLSAVGRLEHSTIWGNNFTYRGSASYAFGQQDAAPAPTRLLASIGTGFRSPTQYEMFGRNPVLNYQGNPDLRIAKSMGGDLGVEQYITTNHKIALTGFWLRINDQVTMSPDYTTQINGSHATSYGLESCASGNMGDAWNTAYTMAFTAMMPQNSDHKQLTATARYYWNLNMETSPHAKVTAGFGVLGAMQRTDWKGKLDDFTTVRVFLRYKVNKTLTLHARMDNLLNEKYTTSTTYPDIPINAWGRTFSIGATLEF